MEITLEEAKKTKQCYKVLYAFYKLENLVKEITYFRYKADANLFVASLDCNLAYAIIKKY